MLPQKLPCLRDSNPNTTSPTTAHPSPPATGPATSSDPITLLVSPTPPTPIPTPTAPPTKHAPSRSLPPFEIEEIQAITRCWPKKFPGVKMGCQAGGRYPCQRWATPILLGETMWRTQCMTDRTQNEDPIPILEKLCPYGQHVMISHFSFIVIPIILFCSVLFHSQHLTPISPDHHEN